MSAVFCSRFRNRTPNERRVCTEMTLDHPRNTGPMLLSPRCGAMNQNALKHGVYTREAIAERRQFDELLRQSRALIAKMKSGAV